MKRTQELMQILFGDGYGWRGDGCRLLLILMFMLLLDLPSTLSYLSQRDKANESEAKQYVASINKAQQAYFLDHGTFANSVKALETGIKTETKNYQYLIRKTQNSVFNYGGSKNPKLKSFVGGVFGLNPSKNPANAAQSQIATASILCITDSPATIKPAEPTYQNGKIACGQGTTEVRK